MADPEMPLTLTLYRRPGCHLCDDAESMLADVLATRSTAGEPVPTVASVDITTDDALEARYGARIPVIAVGDEELDLVTSAGRIRRLLERAFPVDASV